MKLCLKNISIFLFIGFTYIILVYITNNLFIKSNSVTINTNLLIIGDSHPQMSINPALLYKAKNVSQRSELYIITFYKFKKVLNTNNIDTVILGLSYHNLSVFNDLKFKDITWSRNSFDKWYPLISLNILQSNNLGIDYKNYFFSIFKNMCITPKSKHYSYIGYFDNRKADTFHSDSASSIQRHYFNDNQNIGISSVALKYLDSIIEITDNKKNQINCSRSTFASFILK